MRLAPAATIEVLLGLPPLHVMTEVEAQAGIYRLMCSQQWKPKSTNIGHARQSHSMEHKPILQTRTDKIKPFTVKFPDKCEGQNGFKPVIKGVWSGLVHEQVQD